MNKNRRKEILSIIEKVEEIVSSAQSRLETVKEELDFVLGDEQNYLDMIPENLQGSERYEIAEQAVENLDNAMSAFEELIDSMDTEELIGYLNDAIE